MSAHCSINSLAILVLVRIVENLYSMSASNTFTFFVGTRVLPVFVHLFPHEKNAKLLKVHAHQSTIVEGVPDDFAMVGILYLA